MVGPSRDFVPEFVDFANASAAETLTRHRAEFAFGDIEPTAVCGSVHKLNPLDVGSSHWGLEHLVGRPFGLCIEVVENQGHALTMLVACVQQLRDHLRPISL